MMHEEKKVAKIAEELTMFFFALGAEHLRTEIEREGKTVIISMQSDYKEEYKDKLEGMSRYLNQQKNDGMEDIYWELAGSGDPGESSQLLLVGMMIDKAEVEAENGLVKLKLYKKLL